MLFIQLTNYHWNYLFVDYNHWLNPSKNIYDKNNLEAQKNSQIFLIDHQFKKVTQLMLLMNKLIVPCLKFQEYQNYNHAKIIRLSLNDYHYKIILVHFIQNNW